MSDRSGLTIMEQRALERMDQRRDELIVRGRMQCDADTPVVYVARHHTAIIGVFGKVGDAEAAVRAHREEAGNDHTGYVVDIAPFFGRLWRPRKGECDE